MGSGSDEGDTCAFAARDASGHLSPFRFTRRAAGPKDVTLKVKYCGVCHSDLCSVTNEWGNSKYPLVPGHEIVGVVEKVGLEVTRFKVGDVVGVSTYVLSCQICSTCQEGIPQHCEKRTVWTYNDTDYEGNQTYGGFSNFMVVNENFTLKVPSNLPLDEAAPLLCAGMTVYSPMKRYGMENGGKNFGVIGLGGLGHMACKFAKAFGMHVTVISTSPTKEKLARESLGADNFIVSRDDAQMQAAVNTLDFIIDTVSASHPLDPYLSLLKALGKLIIVGGINDKLEFSCLPFIFGAKTIGSSCIGSQKELQEMLDFCGEKLITCQIEKIPMSYINEAMKRLEKSDVQFRFVIDVENTLNSEN